MPVLFNDYDDRGARISIVGCRSTRIMDEAIVHNLRFAFGEQIASLHDCCLVNAYDEFASTDMHGDNDARFIEFLVEYSDYGHLLTL